MSIHYRDRFCRICGKPIECVSINDHRVVKPHKKQPFIRCEASERTAWYFSTTAAEDSADLARLRGELNWFQDLLFSLEAGETKDAIQGVKAAIALLEKQIAAGR